MMAHLTYERLTIKCIFDLLMKSDAKGIKMREMIIISEVNTERARCASLVRAVLDSAFPVTALVLVITAERVVSGPPCTGDAERERERCLNVIDTALARDFATNPAAWALEQIEAGAPVPAPFMPSTGSATVQSGVSRDP